MQAAVPEEELEDELDEELDEEAGKEPDDEEELEELDEELDEELKGKAQYGDTHTPVASQQLNRPSLLQLAIG